MASKILMSSIGFKPKFNGLGSSIGDVKDCGLWIGSKSGDHVEYHRQIKQITQITIDRTCDQRPEVKE